jgi:hypothetical protein
LDGIQYKRDSLPTFRSRRIVTKTDLIMSSEIMAIIS